MNESNYHLRQMRIAAAKKLGTHTYDEWLKMKNFFSCCVRCGIKEEYAEIQKDHIVPIYQGGSNSITNIQPLCKHCNASKGPENIDHRPIECERSGKKMFPEWTK